MLKKIISKFDKIQKTVKNFQKFYPKKIRKHVKNLEILKKISTFKL